MTHMTFVSLCAATALALGSAAMATPMTEPASLITPSAEPQGPRLDLLLFARRGADDPAGHQRRGRGADDPAGHAARELAPQELQIFARRGRGKDDPVGHG